MMWRALFLTAIGATVVVFLVLKEMLSYWRKRGVLHLPPSILRGNVDYVGNKRHLADAVQAVYDAFSTHSAQPPFAGFYLLFKPMAVITRLELVKCILTADADHFMNRGITCYGNHPLYRNLMHLDGKRWRDMVNRVQPAFSHEEFIGMIPHMIAMAKAFESSLHDHLNDVIIVNVHDLVESFNMDFIAVMVYNKRGVNSLHFPHSEFRIMVSRLNKNFKLLPAYLKFHFPCLCWIFPFRGYDSKDNYSTQYFMNIARESAARFYSFGFLDNFKRTFPLPRDEQAEDQYFRDIAVQAFSFLSNGLPALNATMICCLYELAMNETIQERAYHECFRMLNDHEEITVAALLQLKYLQQIINETLRKYSPYPYLLRVCTRNYEIEDSTYMLKKGDHVVIPVAAIHNDSRWYPDPDRFDPDRFTQENMMRRPHFTFIPFGLGPRRCIARHYSELQLLLGLFTMLSNYRFCAMEDTPPRLQFDNSKILNMPRGQLHLGVEPRPTLNRSNQRNVD